MNETKVKFNIEKSNGDVLVAVSFGIEEKYQDYDDNGIYRDRWLIRVCVEDNQDSRANLVGYGKTKTEAITDLLRKVIELA